MLSIAIDDAQERDVALLASLSRFVHDMHVEAHPTHFKPFESGAVGEQFRSRLSSPNVRVFIASLGDQPVGYVVVALRERPEDARCLARRSYEIEEIATSLSSLRIDSCSAARARSGLQAALRQHRTRFVYS